ncbi:MAG TPA: tetratricopeptide repeat protein, partial [Candidatus Ozemobacteraceae bacterium]|nr:tetratricopeptide repeat protein [Candidatus Ozemobacteraceae bacterium]
LEKIERALQHDEDNDSLRTWYASITTHLEKIDKARQEAKARELNRKQAELEAEKKNAVLLKAANEAERKRSFEAALINYEKLQAIDPKPAIAAKIEELKKTIAEVKEKQKKLGNDLANATTLFSQEKYDEAYTVLKEVAEDPDAPAEELIVKLVQCCFRLNRLEDAQKYTLKLESISSASTYLPYFNGSLAYRRGDYFAALDLLAPVYSQNPTIGTDLGQMVWTARLFKYKWFFIVFGLMIGYSLLGPIRSWLADLKAAGLQHRINSAVGSANWAAAIPLLQKRLEADLPLSERKAVMVQLADCCLKAGQPHEAKAQALEVLGKDSKHAQATRILGEALYQLRDNTPESIDRIMAAFRLDENRKDLLAFLVENFKSQQADSKTATDILLKHITVAHEDRDTLIYLAKMFFKRSEYTASSLKVFEKATKVAPDAPEYVHGLVQCLTATGRADDAAKWRDMGRQKWPDSSYFSGSVEQSFTAGAAIPGTAKIGLKRETPAPAAAEPKGKSAGKGGEVLCKSCGAGNPAREYYCTSCGKPLK